MMMMSGLPHKLRVQVPLLEAHPDVGVVYGQSIMRLGAEEHLSPEQSRARSGRVFLSMLTDNFCGHHASLLVRRSAFDSAGFFDESLMSYEDWDVSLRLAFHVKFLFVPGAVYVYNVSPHGLWLSRAASGAGAERRRPGPRESFAPASGVGAVHANKTKRSGVVGARHVASDCRSSPAWAKSWRLCANTRRLRVMLVWQARATEVLDKLVSQLGQSGSAVCKICWQFKTATRHGGKTGRRWVRQTIAPILVEIASDPCTSNRDGLCAAACAFANEPSCRSGQKLLLRAIVRSILGHRAYTACMTLYRSLYRKVKRVELLVAKGSQAG